MLSFIAGLEEDQLREAKDRQGKITSAELYRLLLKRWLEHDVTRDRPKGAPPTLSLDERWEAVTQVALAMWPKVERTVRPSELSEALTHDLDKLADRQFDAATAAQLVGARTLLVRDSEGLFSFVHQSVLEWLVANRAAEQLKVGAGEREAVDALTTAKMSPLMADFFISLAGEFAEPWAQNVLAEESAGQREIAKANALLVLERLGKEARGTVQLAQRDLRGQDLSGRRFREANLAGADLTEARLVGADLTQANLEGACLVRANLTSARLGGARLDGANATSASLLGADLRGAGLTRVSLRRAKLVGAMVDLAVLIDCDTFGAAGPHSRDPYPCVSTRCGCGAVALSPEGDLLASSHKDGSLRLWDVATGAELRRLEGHGTEFGSVAFSPDGRSLASGGDDGTVRPLGGGHGGRACAAWRATAPRS